MEALQKIFALLDQQKVKYRSKLTIELDFMNDESKSCDINCPCPCPCPTLNTVQTSQIGHIEDIEDNEDDPEHDTDSEVVEQADYEPYGMDILDMDKGFLRSFGYKDVRTLSPIERQNALVDVVNYGNDPLYVQERLYYIAKMQYIRNPNPYEEDLEWFEEKYELAPYEEP